MRCGQVRAFIERLLEEEQRCSVRKERNLLAHAPKPLHDEIKADFNDPMYAPTAGEVLARRKAFLAKWRLRCRPVATSLEEAGERLFTFVRYPRFVAAGAMILAHGRPRGEERGGGCEPRRAA
jgi:transposase-like protein